jgi:hypothetical protein
MYADRRRARARTSSSVTPSSRVLADATRDLLDVESCGAATTRQRATTITSGRPPTRRPAARRARYGAAMIASTAASAQQLLDRVQRLAQLDELDVDAYAELLRAELASAPADTLADLEARDDRLRALLASLDTFASKAMRILLEHLAVDWPALTGQFRTLLATTVTSYAGDLEKLRQRVAGSAARQDPYRAGDLADAVVAAAERVLDLRGALGDAILGLAVEQARAALPHVDARARTRSLADDTRLAWTALRRDLELVIERPLRVAEQRYADRQQALRTPDLVLDEIPEPSFGELLELHDTPLR